MIGVDEAGRGPLFGRVYSAAVILPDNNFDFSLLKDSKKFTSEKKIREVYDYIKKNALFYSITYKDEKYIDTHNILEATLDSMKISCKHVIDDYIKHNDISNIKIYIDGNHFKPYFHMYDEQIYWIPYECVVKGDSIHKCISAASILAKVERDLYIKELCENEPQLNEYYYLLNNKGYGTKKHIEGIQKYGLSDYHRKTFKLKQKL
jgi:ribonuclease HII|tara:strand:- start:3843 stop:4460 length:618 start_codon:yes stop_codon:yes gene_type:complete